MNTDPGAAYLSAVLAKKFPKKKAAFVSKENVFAFFGVTASLLIIAALLVLLNGCGKNTLCPIEYKVDGSWQRCSYISTTDCGVTLQCSGQLISCLNGAESRTTSCH